MIVVSNPVDILAWKWSAFPQNCIIGSGFLWILPVSVSLLGKDLVFTQESCHGWILGEHGDSSVLVWSGVNIPGIPSKDLNS